jgi:serine phosphatase RsbU (regulator of sigma subunit)
VLSQKTQTQQKSFFLKKEIHIIYIEDSPFDTGLTEHALKKGGYTFSMKIVETAKSLQEALDAKQPDLILSDHSLPAFNSMDALKMCRAKYPGIPFILLTGSMSEEFAVECLLAGMDDYILKSNLIRLPSSVERVLSKKQVVEEKALIENLHKELQETLKVVEIQHKEIIDSINYASRIQDAILPHESKFMEEFHAGFSIFIPRDIVSGDLYWLEQATATNSMEDPVKLLAVVDCTGHGVPGAFMSLLVSELLHQILKDPDINSPAEGLEYLNRRLPESLNKNNKERINDGFDIALCEFDPMRNTLCFAGANRPLWLVRNSEDHPELIEYKGTKHSIGGHTPADQVFENITIELIEGDRLFMFTDGITDQFGGEKGKKMGKQVLKKEILQSAHLSMDEQKNHLQDFIARWKGSQDQVDDMLLMGIEIG